MEKLLNLVLQWGRNKNLIGDNGKATAYSQALKVREEADELRQAVRGFTKEIHKRVPNQAKINHFVEETIDAVGDVLVTLILEADIIGTDVVSCMNDISGRNFKTFTEAANDIMDEDVAGSAKRHTYAVSHLGRSLVRMAQDGRKDLIPSTIGCIAGSLLAFCKQADLRPVDCLQAAYDVISKRKGLTIDGTFIKFENLTEEQRKLIA